MGLSLTWPSCLNDDDKKPGLDCRRVVRTVVHGSVLVEVVDAFTTMLVVMYSSRSNWSWTDDFVVNGGPLCG